MTIPLVDLSAHHAGLRAELDAAIAEVIDGSAFVGGKHVKAFEAAFAAFCGSEHCIGCGNGTDALFLALRALGIGPGDEVITAANSFIASGEAITMAGATPVFVDVDERTHNIDPNLIPAKIGPRTKAIIPVHLFGRPAPMPEIRRIADAHGLFIVEDAAQAHGAEIAGKGIGYWGDAAAFSFYPGKNLGALGDGGAVVTNDEALAERIRMTANHGRIGKYDHMFEGVNSRLDGLQAAVLSVKLQHLARFTEERRAAARRYDQLLADLPLTLPAAEGDGRHVYHLYVIRTAERDRVKGEIAEKGVGAGIHYPTPLPLLPAYAHHGVTAADIPVAARLAGEILSLPMFPELQEAQQVHVAEALRTAVLAPAH